MKVALLCGGPSHERGISLNSARSVMDHLSSDVIEIVPVYFDTKKNAYKISTKQLYSNTPSDFDFKLQQTATPLSKKEFIAYLKQTDIVFPAIHGSFGEDGEIQSFLEKNNIPFVGSSSEACKKAFDKYASNKFIEKEGFFTLPSEVLKIYHDDHQEIITTFFKRHNLKRAIIKPASSGSSIGVFSVTTPEEALEKVRLLFSKRMDTRVVIEPFAQGKEFTVIILENRFGLPVALPATEIKTDYTKNQIFDFRRKYLPTGQVSWHCPPDFSNLTIEKIQAQATQLFALFGIHDFTRFDGWVLDDGNIWFSDFNPVSGMEQNSFLFQQASRIGMTHQDILNHIVKRSCMRQGIPFPSFQKNSPLTRQEVSVLFGGSTAERQVSLMSGTNAWLKLHRSETFKPQPYLLDKKGDVWKLPYHLCLNHTVEEIALNCEEYQEKKHRLQEFEDRARLNLGLRKEKDCSLFFEPEKISLDECMNRSHFMFLGLHGGEGENGTLQKKLTEKNIPFNGTDAHVSALCMDKWKTAQYIKNIKIDGLDTTAGKTVKTKDIAIAKQEELHKYWNILKKELVAKSIIVKPRADGCSTGIVHLHSGDELITYLSLLIAQVPFVPKNTFKGQRDFIELPTALPEYLVFEKFVETDILRVKSNTLKHTKKSGWIEITVGVIEQEKDFHVLNPSITVAEGDVLSVEEKFQGGTGINITPPPPEIMNHHALQRTKKLIKRLVKKMEIRGYARVDAFAHIQTGDLLIIEVNTLPALTPSTVLYQQALAETRSIFPKDLIELLITNKQKLIKKEHSTTRKSL